MALSVPQETFVEHTGGFVVFLGGRQSGKTEAALQRADKKAKDGESVTFITTSQAGVKDACDRLHTLSIKPSGGYKSGTLQKVTNTRATYASGGEVVFFNGSRKDNIRGLHPTSDREFIVDEVSRVDAPIIDMLCDAPGYNGSVHVTTTPSSPDMPVVSRLLDAGYETVLATSTSNPSVSSMDVSHLRQVGDAFEDTFLLGGHSIGGHILTMVNHYKERHITCPMCDFEVQFPFEDADADIATATQYAFGMALDCACV